MIQNPVETVNALEKLADIIGKKTLVMWCIVTTFTTGYLFIDGRKTQETRISEIKISNEKLIEEIKGIRKITNEHKLQIESTIPKLDTTINNVNQTLINLKNKK